MPPTQRASHLNIVLGLLSLIGIVVTAVFFIAPLKTLPGDLNRMQGEVRDIGLTQAVQTEALKTLADVASDTKNMRRDVDRNTSDIQSVKRDLDRLDTH